VRSINIYVYADTHILGDPEKDEKSGLYILCKVLSKKPMQWSISMKSARYIFNPFPPTVFIEVISASEALNLLHAMHLYIGARVTELIMRLIASWNGTGFCFLLFSGQGVVYILERSCIRQLLKGFHQQNI